MWSMSSSSVESDRGPGLIGGATTLSCAPVSWCGSRATEINVLPRQLLSTDPHPVAESRWVVWMMCRLRCLGVAMVCW
jgi:hypothetical protein